MRFHVISLPHTQTTKEYSLCAYTEKVRKFSNMMMGLGHEVFLYAGEENEADCTEFITVVTKADQKKWFGEYDFHSEFFRIEWETGEYWPIMAKRAGEEIAKRKQPNDFICVISGAQHAVAAAHPDLMTVEIGIGYSGTFSPYRVFESYAWMHAVYGSQAAPGQVMSTQGRFYDVVIPNYFEKEDFPFSAEQDDYYLYIGRMIPLKGLDIAVEVSRRLGKKLILAGQGTPPEYGEYVGSVGPKERGRLMSRAKAVFVPTLYLEPFGGVNVEAQMCGTPVITTDWGAFTETVQQGVTGYRCHTIPEFCQAAKDVEKLDRKAIRKYAQGRYSTDVVALEYEKYFKRLLGLRGKEFGGDFYGN